MKYGQLENREYNRVTPEGKCVYHENISDKWNILWHITRKRYITIIYRGIENTVADTINATYVRCTMARLGEIPLS